MRWLASIAFGVMHAACSSSSAAPDALTADASTGGLIVELVANGGVPQMPAPSIEITQVVIGVKSLRVIGDAAPGDMRTTRTDQDGDRDNHLDLDWHQNLVPIPQLFSAAPPGVYSTVELHVADSKYAAAAITISGRATRGGNLVPFEIQNVTADVVIGVGISTVLVPRQFSTTTIAVDVPSLIEGIDWDAVPLTTDGKLYITDGDAQMTSVVSKISTAFRER